MSRRTSRGCCGSSAYHCPSTLLTLLACIALTLRLAAVALPSASSSFAALSAGMRRSATTPQGDALPALLILVQSAEGAKAKRRRERCRSSWIRFVMDRPRVAVRFIVAPSSMTRALAAEQSVRQDLIIVNRTGTGSMVGGAALTLAGLVWSVRSTSPQYDFVHITADDAFVHVPALLSLLAQFDFPQRLLIASFAAFEVSPSHKSKRRSGGGAAKGDATGGGLPLEQIVGATVEHYPSAPSGDAVLSRDIAEVLVETNSIAPLDVDGGSLGVWLAGMMVHRVHSRRFVSALDARRAGTHEYPGVCRVGEWASQRVARSANLAKVMGAIQRCPVVTATGAWEIGEGTDFALDVELAANISSVLAGTTVADFGAGVGALCKYLEIDDRVAATQCFDGSPEIDKITQGFVKHLDLSTPVNLGVKFDWVVSLGVGAFLPAVSVDTFVENIARHAGVGIILSWGDAFRAVHGHDRNLHVAKKSSRTAEELRVQMRSLGFRYAAPATEQLRRAATFPWLKAQLLVFIRVDAAATTRTAEGDVDLY